jgi:hypothetical protein
MSISAIGTAATPPLQLRQQPAPARSAVTAPVGGDSDGDNDGSKGGTVDVRA